MSLKLNSYLSFNGNCAEALARYEKVFQSKIAYSCTYGEQQGMPEIAEADKNKMLHCYLPINEHVAIMGADTIEGFGDKLVQGNNMSINISLKSGDEAKRIFTALSEGGHIIMPLQKTFWAELYAQFVDAYGINWMINYEKE